MSARRLSVVLVVLMAIAWISVPVGTASADDFALFAFQQTWERTDQPVASHQANRAWVWGPEPISPLLTEPDVDGTINGRHGVRWVQYFDKGRLQITDSGSDSTGAGYVTAGLLAKEMITGKLQLGGSLTMDTQPASINVVGDASDPTAPTYASLRPLLSYAPIPQGWRITQVINRAGKVSTNPTLGGYGVTAAIHVEATHHSVASVFWDYMTSSGPIRESFEDKQGRLFANPYEVTGYPITEPYWTLVAVNGKPKLVLIQAFERRVLTYTPDNPPGWQVESTNIGRHYYAWRYLYQDGNPLVIDSLSYRQDPTGKWVFLGDLTNKARAAYGQVRITVNLYDAADKPLLSTSAYLDLAVVASQEQVPFRVWLDSGTSFARAEVLVEGQPADRMTRPALTLQGAPETAHSDASYIVRGTVKNDSDVPLKYVAYVIALYDANGWVVGYDWGMVSPATLDSGQTATFNATVIHPTATVAKYKVFFSGT